MLPDKITYWDTDHQKRMGFIEKDCSQYSIEKEMLFPRNCDVADFGGGTGGDAIYFLQKGHRVTIYDISPVALSYAKQRVEKLGLGGDLSTKQIDLENQSLETAGKFSVAYARLSLHYFNTETTGTVFQGIYKTLMTKGSAYITLKSPADTNEMAALRNRATEIEPNVFLDEGMIKSRFSIDQLLKILRGTNIKNFEVKEITERLIGKGQTARTGTNEFILNEIVFSK